MVRHSLNDEYSGGGSEVSWEDGERIFRSGWRTDDSGNRRAVLVVRPAVEHPSRSSLDRLTHEYELKEERDGTWAVRPLDLVRDAGPMTLVLEDTGGEPLEALLGAPVEVGRFWRLAIGTAAALRKLHQRGLIHKDIKSANILVNSATDEAWLTGSGIASRLARERQSPHRPKTIAGTLAYRAPGQTGRMNRSIYSRSDLYALGVTFYQTLTDALPFTAADPMELVHCSLARQPVWPVERLKEIPGAISGIVMKLLAKRAEDRYLPRTLVTVNFVDVAGNPALIQAAIVSYRTLRPDLVSKVTLSRATAPELTACRPGSKRSAPPEAASRATSERQSHLTRVFSHHVGETNAVWRRQKANVPYSMREAHYLRGRSVCPAAAGAVYRYAPHLVSTNVQDRTQKSKTDALRFTEIDCP
jgi:serine/threonine protein kinase